MPPELLDPLELPRMMLNTKVLITAWYCLTVTGVTAIVAVAFGFRK